MEKIEQLQLKIETLTKEFNPTADVTPGSVLDELVVKSMANAQMQLGIEMASFAQGATVQAALDSPTETYNESVALVASNFGATRNQGRKSGGYVKLVVRTNKTYFLPAGFSFTQPSLSFEFATTQAYSINSTDSAILLKQEGGLYYMVVPVESSVPTADSNVSNGTRFTLTTASSLPEMVSATAYGNFSSGQSRETDRELIARFKVAGSSKNLLSSDAVNSVVGIVAPDFRSASLVGLGDPELARNRNNIFGIGLPGMVDCYVRTSTSITTKKIVVTGTKIVSGPNTGKWQVEFGADDLPGFYRIIAIVQSKGGFLGTQQLLSTTYGFDTTVESRPNQIATAKDARFTRYQTCTVVFDFTSSETTAPFDVTVEMMPYIAEVQAMFLNNNTRVPACDYLVRAVVPCNVSISLRVTKQSATQLLDVAGIKRGIFNYVNSLKFGESVHSSAIVNICHNFGVRQVELPILLTGRILLPVATGNDTVVIRGTDRLDIPNLPEQSVTSNTAAFFLDYFDATGKESIGVQVA